MNKTIIKVLLAVANYAVDRFERWLDVNKDGTISMDEIMQRSKDLDTKTRRIYKKLKAMKR